MRRDIRAAREHVRAIRYSGDRAKSAPSTESAVSEVVRDAFYKSGILISEQMTPALAEKLTAVCRRLDLPEKCVAGFVYASPDLQASCLSTSPTDCIVQFSSNLVELLEYDEFAFVAGHEFGHFLLGHGTQSAGGEAESIEHFIQTRAQEISADRVGLVACGSLDSAVRALIKIFSGLSERHLRFDVGEFVSQLSRTSKKTRGARIASTHPSMIARCRALLRFSTSECFSTFPRAPNSDQLAKLDRQIRLELDKYVDAPARQLIQDCKTNLSMWMAALRIVELGTFTAASQQEFAVKFGDDVAHKLKNFLTGLSKSEARDQVDSRMRATRQELARLIPNSFDAELRDMEYGVSNGSESSVDS